MTPKEYELSCKIAKLEKENKELRLKNKNLEIKKNIKKSIEDCEQIYRRLIEGK